MADLAAVRRPVPRRAQRRAAAAPSGHLGLRGRSHRPRLLAEGTIRDFDADHISYRPVDTSDPCAITLARFGPQVQDFRLWLTEASDAEKAMAQEELAAMMESIREEIAASSCSFESEAELTAALEAVSVPDPVSVRWDELGVTVPETWRPWSTVYTYDGQRFIDVGKPFDDGLDVGFLTTADDRLWVSTYDPAAKEEVELETRWSTADGVNWDRHVIRFDQYENGYYEPYWPAPIIGDQTYRVWWDESMSEWDEEPAVPEPGQETEQETEQEAGQPDPEPLVQRSIAGGGWETLTLAELAPGIDVGDRVLQDVRGTTFGVVLIYVEPFVDGPPAGGQMLVYSNNGIDWHTVQIPGNGLDIHSSEDSLLVLAHHWPYEEGDEAKTIALMMRPS